MDRQNRRTPASYASLISPECARKTARCSFSAMSTLAHCYVMQCGSISGSRFRISSLTHMRSCDTTQPTLPSFFFDDPIATLPLVQHFVPAHPASGPGRTPGPPSVTHTRTKWFHHKFLLQTRSGLLWSIRKRLETDHSCLSDIFFLASFDRTTLADAPTSGW